MTMPIKHNKGETYVKGMELTLPKAGSFKLDGIRISGQDGTLITNSGIEPPNRALIEKFAPIIQGLDGEFLYGPPNDPLVMNKTFSAVMRKKAASTEGVKFYVFDRIELDNTFQDRYEANLRMAPHPDIIVLEQYPIRDLTDLEKFYAFALDSGYEGAVFRNYTARYKPGRSTLLSQDNLKYKPFADDEFIVEGVYEAQTNNNEAEEDVFGRTKRASNAENKSGNGMIGGFEAIWNGLPFRISAGSLTHEERRAIFLRPEKYKGRLGVYRHMDHGRVDVPRHGRFKCWRDKIDLD
jgi:DNA ligase-1